MTSIIAAVGLVAGLSVLITGVLLRYASKAPRAPECYDAARNFECTECPLVCKQKPDAHR
ncbi:hypothetical protein [Candidatus Laterigemmans baculatus]|uniref:hypothetical protein n=1 Tax=Candidatus Laterigemmans baculatus TaxID=2770505 RepID=UPI0013DBFB32|nr:hypothetical protein [Candidatus Laterigemmans baculatus]